MARLIYFLIFTPLVEAAVLVFGFTLFETRSLIFKATLEAFWWDRWWGSSGHTHRAQESFARIRPDDCCSNSSKQQLGQATKRSPELYEHTRTKTEGRRASFTRSFNHLLFHRPHYYYVSYTYQADEAASASHIQNILVSHGFSSFQLRRSTHCTVTLLLYQRSVPNVDFSLRGHWVRRWFIDNILLGFDTKGYKVNFNLFISCFKGCFFAIYCWFTTNGNEQAHFFVTLMWSYAMIKITLFASTEEALKWCIFIDEWVSRHWC